MANRKEFLKKFSNKVEMGNHSPRRIQPVGKIFNGLNIQWVKKNGADIEKSYE